MKVAIVGAGILGLSTAYILAKKGFSVSVFEKQAFPPENASSIAGGMLAPFSEIETLPDDFVRAGLKGIEFWDEFLGDDASDILQKTGSLLIAHPEDGHMLDRFAQHLHSVSNHWEGVDRARIDVLEPSLGGKFTKGLYLPLEANVNPLPVLTLLAQKLGELGGEIIHAEAHLDDLKEDATYDWVIDCRGYIEGQDQDLRGIKGEIILLENDEFTLQRPVRLMHPRYPLYIIPRPDNVFAVGASVIENSDGDDGFVLLRSAMELMSAAYSLHSSFGEARILDMSSAVRPAYLDSLPRIKVDHDQKYIRCNGLFRHGYLLSPIMGECVANLLDKGEENIYFSLFSGRCHG
ncbi:MAG: glycine oxidase [Zetaproteobacteria bacterium]|nr:MAG: glycine oxidase [Zetaproteobacteria bacterium]